MGAALAATYTDCLRTNTTLAGALGTLKNEVTSYLIRTQLLNGSDFSNLQKQFKQGDYSWLEGHNMFRKYQNLIQYLDCTPTSFTHNSTVTSFTKGSAKFLSYLP